MRCSTCGAELPPGAIFCPNCGTRAPEPSSAGVPTTLASQPQGRPLDPAPPLAMPPPEGQAGPYAPYPPQGYYAPPQPANSTAAIVSLVFGILAWTVLPFIGALVAVIAGHMARNEIRRSGGQLSGDGLAVAGMIMGYAQIVLGVLVVCFIVAIGVLTLLGSRVAP
ncbi:MAG TPA: DUF4190 domain-containing protein [Roseiflexaceae bacterium]|nr:DUF4190 domain-containing protein [Roseiflexaceae bacterium]